MSLAQELAAGIWTVTLPVARTLDGDELTLTENLRLLPGKRATLAGTWGAREVVAKVFLPDAQKEQTAEVQGFQALQQAGIPTPALLWSGELEKGLYAVLYEKLVDAQSLADGLKSERRNALLAATFELLTSMHRAGLWQTDIHFDNFLLSQGRLQVVDNASLRYQAEALSAEASLENLAAFVSQFSWRERASLLSSPYLALPLSVKAGKARAQLDELSRKAWWKRAHKYLQKVFRNCTEVAVEQRGGWYMARKRQLDEAWCQQFRAAPDSIMVKGELLKDGNSATVVRSEIAGQSVVIKRYNIKSSGHRLRRLFRETRASNAWRAAYLLKMAGIKTPEPLVLLEQRRGPLRGVAYLVTADAQGEEMLDVYQQRDPSELELDDVADIFRVMRELRLCHGDFKARNFLVTARGVELIDLDVFHIAAGARFSQCGRRDRERFLRNWYAQPAMEARFKALLAESDGAH